MLISRVLFSLSDAPDTDIQRADELIARALVVSPNSAWAHYAKGNVLRAQSRFEDAAVEYETAIAFDPNLANAYARLGSAKLFSGSVDEVIPPVEYAIRLSPRDRNLPDFYWLIGAAYLLRTRIDEAVGWLEKSRSAHAGADRIHAALAPTRYRKSKATPECARPPCRQTADGGLDVDAGRSPTRSFQSSSLGTKQRIKVPLL